jgi:hypothetical protein
MKKHSKQTQPHANFSSAMETGNHSKNEASLKRRLNMKRNNTFHIPYFQCLFYFIVASMANGSEKKSLEHGRTH